MQRNLKALSLCLALSFIGSLTEAEPVSKFVTKEEKIREEMVVISRELGVTCTECHNVQNFASSEKKTFRVGKDHMKLTQMLKDNGFDGKKGPMATCYMCHRGKLSPDYKEPLSAKAQ
ncbi:MAG: photosynthetic reaction center cytochrome c subunit [Bdellovibrio sp.]|nr:photosynthetic reaction center cytochrome c subunit [Bdellovibrio sp.]